MVEFLAKVVLLVSSSWLLLRAADLGLRVSRSRRAYPDFGARSSFETVAQGSRVYGSLLGVAVGDALGLPAESLPRWLIRWRYRSGPALRGGVVRFVRRRGDISDDTQLTIAVMRSILPGGRYSHERFRDELRTWFAFRVAAGRSTTRAARRLWRDREAPPQAEASEGNGVAIRVAPLGLLLPSEAAVMTAVEQNAAETHAGHAAVTGAKLVAGLVHTAARGEAAAFDGGGAFDALVARLAGVSGFSLERYRRALERSSLSEQLRSAGTSAWVVESVTAVLLVLRAHSNDFEAAMRAVFFAGGDTDSVASMVGGVLGALHGAGGIPERWQAVSCRGYLAWLAARASEPSSPGPAMSRVQCVSGDLSQCEVDVIVNAWNRNVFPVWLLLPQGVSGALRRRGGRAALAQISRRPPLPLGGAAETGAGQLRARWVIHTAGIGLSWRASRDSIRLATASALRLAEWLGARTVALPVIGGGTGGVPAEVARAEVVGECAQFSSSGLEITVVSWAGEPSGVTAPRRGAARRART